jgi:phospholipid/cholesterol/gamma-HCH transport system ATP-binding protein
MIRLENVTFGYSEVPVLQDVSFQIAPGESRVIMGPSGSGKSTILRLILGLDHPWSGRIYFDGRDIATLKAKELQAVRKRIGMVFQDGALFDSMTIGENVGYYQFEYSRKREEEIEREVRQMLQFIDLDAELIDRLPEELSGGMRRRVAIARALLSTRPDLMLFDEPTTGLDPQTTFTVLNLIKKLQEVERIAVVIVTHQIADAFRLADKFVVIHTGRLVFDGGLDQLRECQTPEVQDFLSPFRNSIGEVVKRNFV